MKSKGILLVISILLLYLLSGCVVSPDSAKPVVSDDTVSVRLFAKDYIGKDKAQIESLLGGFVQEEYYNGGLIHQFARSDMWFHFGTDSETYADVPKSATCCFVLAPLQDAGHFDNETISGAELSETLGMDFGAPVYDEMDCMYNYVAEQDSISCLVSCDDNGIVSVKEDFITYSLVR